jgi:hypothetical protein
VHEEDGATRSPAFRALEMNGALYVVPGSHKRGRIETDEGVLQAV